MLITLADFTPYVDITSNIDVVRNLEPYILQAQQMDLRPLVGEQFYHDLITNQTVAKYVELINGITYTPVNSLLPIRYEGLKAMLVYWTHARYLTKANIKSTMTGLVRKENQYSEPLRPDELARLAADSRSMAMSYEYGLDLFLKFRTGIYPAYKSCHIGSESRSSLRVTSI